MKQEMMHILELDTGLFPDSDTVRDAVREMTPDHKLSRIDTALICDDAAWDAVATAILAADMIITV